MSEGTLVLTIVGVVVVAVLGWLLWRALTHDKIEALLLKRKSSSIVASEANYIEGPEKVSVALCLTRETIFYENQDLEARLDLDRIDEVEYDSDLVTGSVHFSGKVLRLRSHGQTFEFVMKEEDMVAWREHLPPHRADEPGTVHAE